MHCNMWAVAHTVRELEMNPGSSVLPLALEEFDVLASPSAESPCRLLSRTTTLRLATEQDAVSILPPFPAITPKQSHRFFQSVGSCVMPIAIQKHRTNNQ